MLVRETSSNNREAADEIYDEVYNWAVYQSGGDFFITKCSVSQLNTPVMFHYGLV